MLLGVENLDEKRPTSLFLKHVIRKIFLEDWVMKLVALAITFALWLGVTGLSTPGSESYTVPLNLRTSDNSVVTNSPNQEVEIRVSGDKRKIGQIKESDLRVSLDLTDVAAGDHVVSLTPDSVSIALPLGIKLDAIRPNKFAIRLENVEEKEIAVKPETEGEVPDGFEIYISMPRPDKVRVRGPASFIKSLTFVSTEKIDLTNRNTDFTAKQIPLSISNPKATLLETVVDVTFRIGEARIEKVYLVPIKDGAGKKERVVLFGARSLFDNVKAQDLQVEIFKNDAGKDVPSVTLPPELRDNVEVRKPKVN